MYIYISFEILDQKALEDFSDINPYFNRVNHMRSRNLELHFPWQHSTVTTVHLLLLVVHTF